MLISQPLDTYNTNFAHYPRIANFSVPLYICTLLSSAFHMNPSIHYPYLRNEHIHYIFKIEEVTLGLRTRTRACSSYHTYHIQRGTIILLFLHVVQRSVTGSGRARLRPPPIFSPRLVIHPNLSIIHYTQTQHTQSTEFLLIKKSNSLLLPCVPCAVLSPSGGSQFPIPMPIISKSPTNGMRDRYKNPNITLLFFFGKGFGFEGLAREEIMTTLGPTGPRLGVEDFFTFPIIPYYSPGTLFTFLIFLLTTKTQSLGGVLRPNFALSQLCIRIFIPKPVSNPFPLL